MFKELKYIISKNTTTTCLRGFLFCFLLLLFLFVCFVLFFRYKIINLSSVIFLNNILFLCLQQIFKSPKTQLSWSWTLDLVSPHGISSPQAFFDGSIRSMI